MDERDSLVTEFLIESHENLDRLDRDLVALEKDPQNRERLGSIFRTIHTIKGTCGFLGFTALEAVSHAGENLLSRLRDLELTLDAEITTGLLAMVDAVRQILGSIERTGTEGDADHRLLIAQLTRLNESQRTPGTDAAADAVDDRRLDEDPRRGDDRRQAVSDSSLRIDVGLLDKLMNLVGELVLARNQILQFTATQTHPGFIGASGRLNLVTSELQEGVMKTRMQPIGNVWGKFPRLVRDLATACGKQVRIEMDGKQTELDKTIIEAIKDPLTHVVRNAVDHGIERPAERTAAGKPAEGCLRLRAFHEGGQINIEIADDGAGINAGRVREKAVQRGLVPAEQARSMSDHEVLRLIFTPGFSTAEQVTNVSGRGVGMDVVKTNIERIGGQVDVQSTPGAGTTLHIKIPLTLAIIPALMVATGGDRYAIPQVNLLELVRLDAGQARTGIERVDDALFYRLRGDLLPLVDLHRQLEVEPAGGGETVNVVVLKAGDRQFGLVVEEIHDTEEIVVKPLGKQLKGVNAFAGATIMGDGQVALILDVLGIALRARVVTDARDRSAGDRPRTGAEPAVAMQQLLLFRVGQSERMAIPLHQVARLEEFTRASVERSGGRPVVQYRDAIMPLVSLAEHFGIVTSGGSDVLPVIVVRDGDRTVGLVVDQIIDIVNERLDMPAAAIGAGVRRSVVLQERVTDLIDLQTVIRGTGAAFTPAAAAA